MMENITITIGKKQFSFQCEKNNIGNIKRFAKDFDKRFNAVTESAKELDFETCLVLSSILILSEMEDFKNGQMNLIHHASVILKDEIVNIKNVKEEFMTFHKEILNNILNKLTKIKENVEKIENENK